MSVVPAGRVLGLLNMDDPLFPGEGVGFVPAEEGELGKVSLAEVFNLIGHCIIQNKPISLKYLLSF
jgi:hypothetical protein